MRNIHWIIYWVVSAIILFVIAPLVLYIIRISTENFESTNASSTKDSSTNASSTNNLNNSTYLTNLTLKDMESNFKLLPRGYKEAQNQTRYQCLLNLNP